MPSHSGLERAAVRISLLAMAMASRMRLLGGAGLTLEAGADAFDSDGGGLFAGGLSADAIDDQEDAAVGIEVEGVLVVAADASGVGAGGGFEGGHEHERLIGGRFGAAFSSGHLYHYRVIGGCSGLGAPF